ncbi:MAG: ThiF family adenylyltransferase, partial [Aestuariivita sp.]|nr:ThiF family adenylyltransferase [Aestuariivita sp.]
ELLARNCIGSLVLIDPDVVEEKNLNRIMNTKKSDAEKGVSKVEVLKQAIEKMGMNVNVEIYKSDTYDRDPIEALVDCDIIFGCVDSAAGRYHLECVSKAYFIPYFDVGVYLESDGKGGISQANAVSRYIHPDSCSLLNRGVYTSEQVTAERLKRDNVEYYEKQIQEGYVKGAEEDQPAVMSVNMQAACLAFNDFLARLHSFRLDDNSKFGTQTFQLVQGCYLNEEDEGDDGSIFEKYLGTGEESLLIQNLKRRKKS